MMHMEKGSLFPIYWSILHFFPLSRRLLFGHKPKLQILLVGLIATLVLLGVGAVFFVMEVHADEKNYHRLVILGDPHLPGKEMSAKESVIKTINSWNDVDMVVVLGDICFELGTSEEYAFAKQFFSKLKKPVYFINGNHDYIYDDILDSKGRKTRAYSGNQQNKLKLFKETFNLPELNYAIRVGHYSLIFLAADELGSSDLARISQRQLDWLGSELNRNRKLPTIIFFHAPLKGTLRTYNQHVNTPSFVAQPEDKIRELILQNSQLFLWVSGHTHTPPTNDSYASDVNLYEKRVTNIHNCDMNRSTIWTNSLYLYPDKVSVRTFDHKKGAWLSNLDRTILSPGAEPLE
jgi:3',5'-cyclic-AMP phosphodiesterase